MNIGILGGTFDPLHKGHLMLADSARKEYKLEKILFVPALIPPHKIARRDLTPAPYRFRMVEMAIQAFPGFELSDIEINRPEISYTVDTLRSIRQLYPHAPLYLIMGVDSLADMPQWKDPHEILKMTNILVASRPGCEKQDLPYRDKISWIGMPENGISSSDIRKRIRQGDPCPDVLPENVREYIQKMKLYQKESS